ncbi:hypothetical protein [Erwinia endophytica]|uniref:hypothetical protein n=1 Tax=Erwinia endophytica TaxID=1563158 RepID=UPI00308462A2
MIVVWAPENNALVCCINPDRLNNNAASVAVPGDPRLNKFIFNKSPSPSFRIAS